MRGTYQRRGEVRDVFDPFRGSVYAIKITPEADTATMCYNTGDVADMVHDSLKVDRHVLRNKVDLHQRACRCDARVSLVSVRTKCAFATRARSYRTSESLLWTRADVAKYVIRLVPRDVAQSGHSCNSIITGAHETLSAGSAIASDVHERSTRNQRRLSSRTNVYRTDYRGNFSTSVEKERYKTTPGPGVEWLDTFNNPHESANTLWVKCVSVR
jgi:hypothetical protein